MYITNREIGAITYASEQLRHIIESADDGEATKDIIQVQNLLYNIIKKWQDERFGKEVCRYVRRLSKQGLSVDEITEQVRKKYGFNNRK